VKARPYVIANFAITADGKVSTRNHTPTGFTSAEDKRRLQLIRSMGDALLAGASTVGTDRMSMGLSAEDLRAERIARGKAAEPLRVIVSRSGRIDPGWKVFQPRERPPLIFTTTAISNTLRTRLAGLADLWILKGQGLDLSRVLAILREDFGVRKLVCEGGPSLFRSLAEIGAVDELRLTWAPLVFGGAEAPGVTGLPGAFLPKSLPMRLVKMERGAAECFLTYKTTV